MSNPRARTTAHQQPSWLRRLATLAVSSALGLGGALVPALTTPAQAAVTPATDCVAALECLRFTPGWHSTGTANKTEVMTIEPVTSEPSKTSAVPWQGTFRIKKVDVPAGENKCLDLHETNWAFLSAEIVWDDCDANPNQRWYAEPLAGSIVTDPASAERWNPWQTAEDNWSNATAAGAAGLAGGFLLRSAGHTASDSCHTTTNSNGRIDSGNVVPCGFKTSGAPSSAGAVVHLYDGPVGTSRWRKSQAHKDALTTWLLGAMVQHGMEQCRADKMFCSVQLRDANNDGALLTAPSRIDDVTITQQPVPVVDAASCAASGSMQRVYNAGDEPMEASLEVGGESTFETSVTHGFEVSATVGVEAFVNASVTVTTSHQWGKTWSESKSYSQSVGWTVPPRRYATAVVATSSVRATSAWTFGMNAPHRYSQHRPWRTDEIVDMSLPYADSAQAAGPDATLAVYNSLDKKSCGAKAPSVLADDAPLDLVNTTTPGASPQIGDVLSVEVNPTDFRTSGTNPSPVRTAYRWYRVRAGESPQQIQRATSARYRVTSDDVAGDEDETETMGRYRLYATVTDVADNQRFDSLEYATLRTAAVVAERPTVQVGATQLTTRVLNPHAKAGDEVRMDLRASAENATSPANGQIVVRVDGEEQAPITMTNGEAQFRKVLPRGVHQLDARFLPDAGEYSDAESDPVSVTVAGRESRTALVADATSVDRGTPLTFTATVSDTQTSAHTPTGTVEFRSGQATLGNPVALVNGVATFTTTLPRGTAQITAHYSGDDRFSDSISGARTVTVNKTRSTVVLDAGQASVRAGSPLPLNATITAGGETVTDGTVQLFVDGQLHGNPVPVNALGNAAWQVNDLTLGNHRLVARYAPAAGDDAVTSATSATVEVQVTRSSTELALTTSTTRTAAGQDVQFRAVVRNSDGLPVTTGKVQLHVDGVPHGRPMSPDRTGRVDVTLATLAVGARQVTARYTPSDPGLEASLSPTLQIQVDKAHSTVTLTPSLQVHATGQKVWLAAQATRADGTVPQSGTVRLYVDGRPFGGDRTVNRNGRVRWQVKGLPVGKRQLMVRYTPGAGEPLLASSSATNTHQVRAHSAHLSTRASARKVTKNRPRVVVSGRLKLSGRKAPAAAHQRIVVRRGTTVVARGRTNARGEYRITVRRAKLTRGVNRLRATYSGGWKPSATPAQSRVLRIVRR